MLAEDYRGSCRALFVGMGRLLRSFFFVFLQVMWFFTPFLAGRWLCWGGGWYLWVFLVLSGRFHLEILLYVWYNVINNLSFGSFFCASWLCVSGLIRVLGEGR